MTFLVLLVAYLFSQFYRAFLAVIAGDLSRDLGLDAAGLSALLAAWFGAFAAAQLPVGMALDRFGPRWTLTAGLASAAFGAAGLAVSDGPTAATLAMVLIGIGCAPVLMAGYYLIARTYPLERFATRSSLLLGFGSLGDPISGAPLALAVQTYGWRPAVAASALFAALTAAAAALILRDPPRLTIPAGTSRLRAVAGVIALRPLWPIVPLGFMAYATVASTRGVWIVPYLEGVHGLAAAPASAVATAMGLSLAGGALLYAPLNRLLGGPKLTAFLGAAVAAGAWIVLGTWGGSSLPAAIACLMVVGALGAPYALVMAHARSFMPAHVVGIGISLMNIVSMGGVSVVQWLSGRYIHAAEGAGMPAEDVFGRLFIAFGIGVVVALAVYGLAPRERSEAP